jgi:hypothetical protein
METKAPKEGGNIDILVLGDGTSASICKDCLKRAPLVQ